MSTARDFDVAVIGGGLVGSAIAWGLAKVGQRVAVLDEGDIAFRASRGNFALVWVQSKGLGMPEYAGWTVRSSEAWGGFADALQTQTGIDVSHQRPGGFHLALSERELEQREQVLKRLHNQPAMQRYDWEIMDRERVRQALPQIGPEVVGASYCPLDGHVNSLRLFRALHTGMQQLGVTYLPNHAVDGIEHRNGEFIIRSAGGEVRSAKLVLAAGNGNARLGPMVGLDVPVRPQRGQIVVTEKAAPFLNYPVVTVRQTDEGGVMLGDSLEEAGFDPTVGTGVISMIADRAVRMFPQLARLNVVRSWAALRVMTKDGFPIYDHSATCPGAFVATCHSGVTLAANHALALAPLIAAGRLPSEQFEVFSARRFHVPAAA
ncbi:FAD-binding oxidoreductase [Reyranella sp. CPCC 100927]|uniref:NAD(P)/FAD-dependent oxidoreductase n=1 Tax=Reyranella sp. CPCC 100927 TaxID=2599616 RepID=UPI0011B39A04|nr:FAD-dependent oxidoreductase [Reyranella sp. CPCC 100927]TWT15198.1 FAD-binding oxidoreductase [Reyranella sp. CPCC 100927]